MGLLVQFHCALFWKLKVVINYASCWCWKVLFLTIMYHVLCWSLSMWRGAPTVCTVTTLVYIHICVDLMCLIDACRVDCIGQQRCRSLWGLQPSSLPPRFEPQSPWFCMLYRWMLTHTYVTDHNGFMLLQYTKNFYIIIFSPRPAFPPTYSAVSMPLLVLETLAMFHM